MSCSHQGRSERLPCRSQEGATATAFLQQEQGSHGMEGQPRRQALQGQAPPKKILRRPVGLAAPAPPQPQVCIYYLAIAAIHTLPPALHWTQQLRSAPRAVRLHVTSCWGESVQTFESQLQVVTTHHLGHTPSMNNSHIHVVGEVLRRDSQDACISCSQLLTRMHILC